MGVAGERGARAVAVVVARAGSKGLAGKNVASVAGRPCVEWTIEDALESSRCGRVLVSSDDERVLAIASRMGATPVAREAEWASDGARVDDAVRACLARAAGMSPALTLGARDGVVILYGNVPVRPAGLIDRALELLERTGCDSVQSYARVGKLHPWWQARVEEGSGRVSPWEGRVLFNGVYRRQDLPASYVPDGGVLAVTGRALKGEVPGVATGPHGFLGLDHRAVVTSWGEVVDIDGAIDLAVADAMLRGEGGCGSGREKSGSSAGRT